MSTSRARYHDHLVRCTAVPQEDVDVESDLVPDLGAVGREPAGEVAGLGGVEEADLLPDEGLEQALPHPHVHPRTDNREDAAPDGGGVSHEGRLQD